MSKVYSKYITKIRVKRDQHPDLITGERLRSTFLATLVPPAGFCCGILRTYVCALYATDRARTTRAGLPRVWGTTLERNFRKNRSFKIFENLTKIRDFEVRKSSIFALFFRVCETTQVSPGSFFAGCWLPGRVVCACRSAESARFGTQKNRHFSC